MTTFNFTLAGTQRKDGTKSIVIIFIKDRQNTSLSIRQTCKPENWSESTSRVKKTAKRAKNINTFIAKYENIIEELIKEFELKGDAYSLSELVTAVRNYTAPKKIEKVYFSEFSTQRAAHLNSSGKISSASLELEALRRLQDFSSKKRIPFNEIDYNFLTKFTEYLNQRNNSADTIGIRLRTIRATFNEALRSGVISDANYPFKDFKITKAVKTAQKRPRKQILTQEEIENLKFFNSEAKKVEFAVDMFLLSYFSRGINYIDLIDLRKRDRHGDHITYVRKKTGATVTFKVTAQVESLFNKYASKTDSKHILNITRESHPSSTYLKNRAHKKLTQINQGLRTAIEGMNLDKHITYYCARHSFASALKFNNVPIEAIREALGHKDIKSTMSYLATLPDKRLDRVIEDVIG